MWNWRGPSFTRGAELLGEVRVVVRVREKKIFLVPWLDKIL